MASLEFCSFNDQGDNRLVTAIVDYALTISDFFSRLLIIVPLALVYLVVLRCLTFARKRRAPSGGILPIRANEGRRYIGKESVAGESCSICLEEFGDESDVAVLSECEHVFHVACVATWTTRSTSCPVCRRVVDVILVSTVVEDHVVLDIV